MESDNIDLNHIIVGDYLEIEEEVNEENFEKKTEKEFKEIDDKYKKMEEKLDGVDINEVINHETRRKKIESDSEPEPEPEIKTDKKVVEL